MRRNVCSRCGEPSESKMAAHYWSHRDAAGVRTAWKQTVCYGCIGPTMALLKANRDGYDGCIACGQVEMVPSSLRTFWLTLFLPKQEAKEAAADVCDMCFDSTWKDTHERSTPLPDRNGGIGAGGPPPQSDPWAAFRAEVAEVA